MTKLVAIIGTETPLAVQPVILVHLPIGYIMSQQLFLALLKMSSYSSITMCQYWDNC